MRLEDPLIELACPAVREMLLESPETDIPFEGPLIEVVCATLVTCLRANMSLGCAVQGMTVPQLVMTVTLGDFLGSEAMMHEAGKLLGQRLTRAPSEYMSTMLGVRPLPMHRDTTWLDSIDHTFIAPQ